MSTCHDVEPLLSDLIDGALTADEQRRVEAHLNACAHCRGIRRDLERVRRAARALGPVPPPDHVWLEIAGHVRPAAGVGARPQTTAETRVAMRQWIGIAAMLVLVTVGAYFVMHTPEAPIGQAGNAPKGDSVQAVTEDFGRAVQDLENVIGRLEVLAKEGDSAIDPAYAATMQQNIRTIDSVIAETRSAVSQAPESAPARESLFEALKTKVGVLQATLNLMNEMRKGDQAAAAEAAAAFGKKSS